MAGGANGSPPRLRVEHDCDEELSPGPAMPGKPLPFDQGDRNIAACLALPGDTGPHCG